MKKLFLLALYVLGIFGDARADANDVAYMQRNATNTGYIQRIPLTPIDGSKVLPVYNGVTLQMEYAAIGTGLSYAGNVLSVTGGGSTGAQGPTGPTGATGAQGVAGAVGNFGAETMRTLAVATQYQANDPAKSAIVTVTPSCTVSATVLASSTCSIQIRKSMTTGLTCSNGTVAYQWSNNVSLGLIFTNASASPMDIKLRAGQYFILCAVSGTFTVPYAEDMPTS